MSYRKLPEIPKAERARKRRQAVGVKVVDRYAWSPYTAEPYHRYTWYADCISKVYVQSPPGVFTKYITIRVTRDTYLGFRDYVLSGEARKRAEIIIAGYGGELEAIEGYWRSLDGENK